MLHAADDHCNENTEFQCRYIYQCLPLDKVADADGNEDCVDRSDEGPLAVFSIATANIIYIMLCMQ